MGSVYYYFAASLPLLEFGVPSQLSLETFLSDCERLLAPEDFLALQAALVDDGEPVGSANPLAREWRRFVRNLRNQLAWVRAGRAQKDPLDYIRGERIVATDIVDAVARAQKAPDPLTGEKMLGELCWRKLDDLVGGHYFDIDYLIAYALKLSILDRLEKMDSVRGQQVFEEYKNEAGRLR